MFSWPSNYDSCFTISGSITRDGVGLHSGEKTKVKISSFEEEGYYVSFADKPDQIYKLDQSLIGSTMLCTAVKLGKRNLYTILSLPGSSGSGVYNSQGTICGNINISFSKSDMSLGATRKNILEFLKN